MKIEYLGGGYNPGEFPETGLPEVCFLGRSNVGKSTLINALVKQRQMARVSSTPGRTQALHFFAVSDRFCLVDFPGYGYAKAPKRVRESFKPLVTSYLDARPNLKGGILLVDVRREPREDEHDIVRDFRERDLPLVIVVTKIDKIAKTRRGGRIQQLASRLGVSSKSAVGFSAHAKVGRGDVMSHIDRMTRG